MNVVDLADSGVRDAPGEQHLPPVVALELGVQRRREQDGALGPRGRLGPEDEATGAVEPDGLDDVGGAPARA